MGWASGSTIFKGVIRAAQNYIDDFHLRKGFYKEAIQSFEDGDWDTQTECLKIDLAFDAALKELYPDWFDEEGDVSYE